MSNLYVIEQGALVQKEGGLIKVAKDGERLSAIPLKEISTLVLFGGVQVSTQAMLALLDAGCDVALMTQNGHFRGRMVSASGKNSLLRAAQYAFFYNPTRSLALAKAYVAAKIKNSKALLAAYHYSTSNPYRCENLGAFDDHRYRAGSAETLDSLRGHEGAAAALYWRNFGGCITCGLEFTKREFHPSCDPVNALLSFGYSFVARELQAVLDALGLDPYIGFYHTLDYGRASLSLDLMEEFRAPLVDRLVLRLFNKGSLGVEDFEVGASGQCYLKKESLKTFIAFFEQFADEKNVTYGRKEPVSWRKAFWEQGEKLRKAIQECGSYEPFTLPETSGFDSEDDPS